MSSKRLVAILLAALMMLLVACSNPPAATTPPASGATTPPAATAAGVTATAAPAPAQSDSPYNALGELPIMKEKTTITLGIVDSGLVEDYETNGYTKRLEEAGNVDIEFTVFPNVDVDTKLAAMLAANEPFPDIMIRSFSDYAAYKPYVEAGVFLPLNDYYENESYYMKEFFDNPDNNQLLPYMYAPDGNIYSVYYINKVIGNEWSYRAWINQTWLDNLGLSMPTTTEEYRDVLTRFKNDDPNGDGKKNELPYFGFTGGWNSNPLMFFGNSFTFVNPDADYMQVDDNHKLSSAINKPEFKEGLDYIQSLVTSGLMDPLTFTQNAESWRAVAKDPNAHLIGSICVGSMSAYQESDNKNEMMPLGPLTGPSGEPAYASPQIALPSARWFVTKYAKDPVLAFRLADYTWEHDTATSNRWGVKGVDWDTPTDPNKKALYWDMGYKPYIEEITSIWGVMQNSHWNDGASGWRPYERSDPSLVWNGDPYSYMYTTALAIPALYQKTPKNYALRFVFTEEEVDEMNEIRTTINSLRNEFTVGYMAGSLGSSDWDGYVKNLEQVGLPRFTEICQAAYDRMQAVMNQ